MKGKKTSVSKATKPNSAAAPKAQEPIIPLLSPRFLQQNIVPIGLLLLLAFALYFLCISYGYVLDDQIVIQDNDFTKKGFGGIRQIFSTDSFQGYFKTKKDLLEGGRYRPLSIATFAMEYGIMGATNPQVSHFFNILFYALTGILMFRVFTALFPSEPESKWYFSLPFVASALFLLHPLHTEAVANIKGRDEILALFFSVAALWAALKWHDHRTFIWRFGAGFFLFLGMLSKENAITFVFVIPLTMWFFTRLSVGDCVKIAMPLLAAALIFIFIRARVLGYFLNPGKEITDLMNNPFYGMTMGERLATISLTLGWYVKLLVFPHPLTHDYYPYHVPKVNWSDMKALGSAVLYAGMAAVALLQLQRRNVISWFFIFFIATISIVSNLFFSVGTFMNERFVYMPSMGFCLLLAWILTQWMPKKFGEKSNSFTILGTGVLALVAAGYAIRTVTRIPDWKDALTLNGSAIKVSPNSARANCFITTALFEQVYKKSNNLDEKKALLKQMDAYITRSLEINPNYSSAMVMQAGIAGEIFQNDHQLDKLFNTFGEILEKKADLKYIDDYMEYLKGRGNMDKYTSFCHRIGYELFFEKKKDFPNAIKYLNYGLGYDTYNYRLLKDMADVYLAKGDAAKSAEYLERLKSAKAAW